MLLVAHIFTMIDTCFFLKRTGQKDPHLLRVASVGSGGWNTKVHFPGKKRPCRQVSGANFILLIWIQEPVMLMIIVK